MALMTKSQQVEKYLRKQIVSGKFAAGDRLPSDRDIRSKFGVSLMTVREALIKLSQDGLIERKQGSGTYVADKVKKGVIGLLTNVNHITSSNGQFFRQVVNESKRHIEACGMQPIVFAAHNTTAETLPSDVHLFDKGVVEQIAGVISLVNLSHIQPQLDKEGIPAVSLPHRYSSHAVVHDYEVLTRLGVKVLRECGYSNIALMHYDYSEMHYDSDVFGNIAEALHEVRDSSGVNLVGVPVSESGGHAYEVFKQLWDGPSRPEAVFFHDDSICDVALRAVLERGIKIPHELGILSMSNLGRHFPFPVQLSTIGFDPRQTVELAWEKLAGLIDGKKDEPAIELIRPTIFEGASLRNTGVVA